MRPAAQWGVLWGSVALTVSFAALHPARLRANEGASWVVRGVAWQVTSAATRKALSEFSLDEAAQGDPSGAGAEESLEEQLAELDVQRDRVLESREGRLARARSFERWLVLVERIERRACCDATERGGGSAAAGDPWGAALELIEARWPRGAAEAGGAYRERIVRQLLVAHPELGRARGAEVSATAEGPRPLESPPCVSGPVERAAKQGCDGEDLVLAGYRMALLIEESFGSCRAGEAGEAPVCLPYVGPTPSACWRALPMDWPASRSED